MHYLLKSLLVLGCILLINTHIHNHTCIHDHLDNIQPYYQELDSNKFNTSDRITPHNANVRNLQTVSRQSIRIYLDYTGINTNLSTAAQNTIVNLANATKNYFESTLSTYPYSGIMKFTSTTCYNAQIPQTILLQGISSADLTIFVTSSWNLTNYIASGVSCLLDSMTNRPIAGQLNFNENFLSTNAQTWDQQLALTMHEMVHILGFSQSLYPYFINPITGSLLSQVAVLGYHNGVPNIQIVLQGVVTIAQKYFGCLNLTGLDLEQQEGINVSTSHWERRIMGNEIMTANYIGDARLSQFTLALLEGTGWYDVNFSMADTFTWGINQGCSFINGPCMNNVSSGYGAAYAEYCAPFNSYGCSWDATALGPCSYTLGIPQYSQWDYYNNGSMSIDPYSDNCPYYQSVKTCESPNDYQYTSLFDAYYGPGSKCFSGNFVKSSVSNYSLPNQVAGCFFYHCYPISGTSDWELHVYFGTNTAVCTKTSGTEPIPNYNGVLNCPNANLFCGTIAVSYCKKGCSGRGTCINSMCICNDGWGGDDCSEMIITAGCSSCLVNSKQPDCIGDVCICDFNSHGFCPIITFNLNPAYLNSLILGGCRINYVIFIIIFNILFFIGG